MLQSIIMLAAAVNLVGVAAFISPKTFPHILCLQFFPTLLAIGLVVFGLARFMGWPV